ncbi:MAG: hypothetical protein AAF511_02025 [Pseudomonadota bacterium]
MFCSEQIDWAATGAMLGGIGSILSASAILVGSVAAFRSFALWRKQQLRKEKRDWAFDALALLYQAEDIFVSVRSPFMSGAELSNASKVLDASDADSFDHHPGRPSRGDFEVRQAYINRVNSHQGFWKKIVEMLPKAKVLFGEELVRLLRIPLGVRAEIIASADSFGSDDPEFQKSLEKVLFGKSDDEIFNKIISTRRDAESLLRDYIELKKG